MADEDENLLDTPGATAAAAENQLPTVRATPDVQLREPDPAPAPTPAPEAPAAPEATPAPNPAPPVVPPTPTQLSDETQAKPGKEEELSSQTPYVPSLLVQQIRTKYPDAYKDVPDEQLQKAIVAKYPVYADRASQPAPPEYIVGATKNLLAKDPNAKIDTDAVSKAYQDANAPADVKDADAAKLPRFLPDAFSTGKAALQAAQSKMAVDPDSVSLSDYTKAYIRDGEERGLLKKVGDTVVDTLKGIPGAAVDLAKSGYNTATGAYNEATGPDSLEDKGVSAGVGTFTGLAKAGNFIPAVVGGLYGNIASSWRTPEEAARADYQHVQDTTKENADTSQVENMAPDKNIAKAADVATQTGAALLTPGIPGAGKALEVLGDTGANLLQKGVGLGLRGGGAVVKGGSHVVAPAGLFHAGTDVLSGNLEGGLGTLAGVTLLRPLMVWGGKQLSKTGEALSAAGPNPLLSRAVAGGAAGAGLQEAQDVRGQDNLAPSVLQGAAMGGVSGAGKLASDSVTKGFNYYLTGSPDGIRGTAVKPPVPDENSTPAQVQAYKDWQKAYVEPSTYDTMDPNGPHSTVLNSLNNAHTATLDKIGDNGLTTLVNTIRSALPDGKRLYVLDGKTFADATGQSPRAKGWTSADGTAYINADASPTDTAATVLHEGAHVLLDNLHPQDQADLIDTYNKSYSDAEKAKAQASMEARLGMKISDLPIVKQAVAQGTPEATAVNNYMAHETLADNLAMTLAGFDVKKLGEPATVAQKLQGLTAKLASAAGAGPSLQTPSGMRPDVAVTEALRNTVLRGGGMDQPKVQPTEAPRGPAPAAPDRTVPGVPADTRTFNTPAPMQEPLPVHQGNTILSKPIISAPEPETALTANPDANALAPAPAAPPAAPKYPANLRFTPRPLVADTRAFRGGENLSQSELPPRPEGVPPAMPEVTPPAAHVPPAPTTLAGLPDNLRNQAEHLMEIYGLPEAEAVKRIVGAVPAAPSVMPSVATSPEAQRVAAASNRRDPRLDAVSKMDYDELENKAPSMPDSLLAAAHDYFGQVGDHDAQTVIEHEMNDRVRGTFQNEMADYLKNNGHDLLQTVRATKMTPPSTEKDFPGELKTLREGKGGNFLFSHDGLSPDQMLEHLQGLGFDFDSIPQMLDAIGDAQAGKKQTGIPGQAGWEGYEQPGRFMPSAMPVGEDTEEVKAGLTSANPQDRALAALGAKDPENLRQLANDKDPKVVKALAANSNTPPEVLSALHDQHGTDIEWQLSRNPSTPVHVLGEIMADPKVGNVANQQAAGEMLSRWNREDPAVLDVPYYQLREGLWNSSNRDSYRDMLVEAGNKQLTDYMAGKSLPGDELTPAQKILDDNANNRTVSTRVGALSDPSAHATTLAKAIVDPFSGHDDQRVNLSATEGIVRGAALGTVIDRYKAGDQATARYVADTVGLPALRDMRADVSPAKLNDYRQMLADVSLEKLKAGRFMPAADPADNWKAIGAQSPEEFEKEVAHYASQGYGTPNVSPKLEEEHPRIDPQGFQNFLGKLRGVEASGGTTGELEGGGSEHGGQGEDEVAQGALSKNPSELPTVPPSQFGKAFDPREVTPLPARNPDLSENENIRAYKDARSDQDADVLAAAVKNKYFISPGTMNQIRKIGADNGGDLGGGEHEVYLDPENWQVWKMIRPTGRYGISKDFHSYVQRLSDLNDLVPELGIKFRGVGVGGGLEYPMPVHTMNILDGDVPHDLDIYDRFTEAGWKPDETSMGQDFIHPSGITIRDAHRGNFLIDEDGNLSPIDVDVQIAPGKTAKDFTDLMKKTLSGSAKRIKTTTTAALDNPLED